MQTHKQTIVNAVIQQKIQDLRDQLKKKEEEVRQMRASMQQQGPPSSNQGIEQMTSASGDEEGPSEEEVREQFIHDDAELAADPDATMDSSVEDWSRLQGLLARLDTEVTDDDDL